MNLLSGTFFAVDFYEIILEVGLPSVCMLKNVGYLWNMTSVVWKDIS